MSAAHTYPDAEVAVRDIVKAGLVARAEVATCTVGGPLKGWTAAAGRSHVEVTSDGTPVTEHPVFQRSTIRFTAWAHSTSEAKRLAQLAHGIACAHDGTGPVSKIRSLTGPLPARDPGSNAELAMTTVQATVRSIPV